MKSPYIVFIHLLFTDFSFNLLFALFVLVAYCLLISWLIFYLLTFCWLHIVYWFLDQSFICLLCVCCIGMWISHSLSCKAPQSLSRPQRTEYNICTGRLITSGPLDWLSSWRSAHAAWPPPNHYHFLLTWQMHLIHRLCCLAALWLQCPVHKHMDRRTHAQTFRAVASNYGSSSLAVWAEMLPAELCSNSCLDHCA